MSNSFRKKRLFSNLGLQDLTKHESMFHPKGLETLSNGQVTNDTVTDAYLFDMISNETTVRKNHANVAVPTASGMITDPTDPSDTHKYVGDPTATNKILHKPLQKMIHTVSEDLAAHKDAEDPHQQYSRQAGVPIGTVIYCMSMNAPAGYIPANGALVKYADYPVLYAFAMTSGLVTTEAVWKTPAGTDPYTNGKNPKYYPNQAKFTYGIAANGVALTQAPAKSGNAELGYQEYSGVTYFRVPCLAGYYPRIGGIRMDRATYGGSTNVSDNIGGDLPTGNVAPDAARAAIGQFNVWAPYNLDSSVDGIVTKIANLHGTGNFKDLGPVPYGTVLKIDPSTQVPTATENRPWTVVLPAYIKATDTIIAPQGAQAPVDVQDQIDALAAALADHKTEKPVHSQQTHTADQITYIDNSTTKKVSTFITNVNADTTNIYNQLTIINNSIAALKAASATNQAIDWSRSVELPFQSTNSGYSHLSSRTLADLNTYLVNSGREAVQRPYTATSKHTWIGFNTGCRRYLLKILQPCYVVGMIRNDAEVTGYSQDAGIDYDIQYLWGTTPEYVGIVRYYTSGSVFGMMKHLVNSNTATWQYGINDMSAYGTNRRYYPVMPVVGQNLYSQYNSADGNNDIAPGAPLGDPVCAPAGWWVNPVYGGVPSGNETLNGAGQGARVKIYPTMSTPANAPLALLYYIVGCSQFKEGVYRTVYDIQPYNNQWTSAYSNVLYQPFNTTNELTEDKSGVTTVTKSAGATPCDYVVKAPAANVHTILDREKN